MVDLYTPSSLQNFATARFTRNTQKHTTRNLSHTQQMPLISEDFKRVVSHPIFQLARRLKIRPKHVNSTCVTSVSTKPSIPSREAVVHAARLSDGKEITEAAFHEGSRFSAMSAPEKPSARRGLPGRRQSYDAYIKPVTSSLPTPNKCNNGDTSTDSTSYNEKDTFCVASIPAESVKFPSKAVLAEDPCGLPAQAPMERIMCQDMLAQVERGVETKPTKTNGRDELFKTPQRAKPSIKRIMGRDMLAQERIRDNLYLFGKLDRRSSLAEVIVATEALGALYSEHNEMVDVPSDEVVAMYLGNTSNSPKDMAADKKENLVTEGLATKPTKQAHMPLRIVIPDRSTPLINFHWPLPPPSPAPRLTTEISTQFANPNLHLVAPFLFSLPPESPSCTPITSLRPSPSRHPKSAIISDISFIPTSTPLPSPRRRSTPILNHNHTLHQITGFRRYRHITESTPHTAIPCTDTVHPLDTSGNVRPSAFTFGKNAMRKARFSIANKLEKRGGQARPVSGLIAFWEGQWRFDAIRREDDWTENVRDYQRVYPVA